MLERELRKKFIAGLRALKPDVWYYSPPAGPQGRVGIPDIIVCAYGQFRAYELKQEKGKLTNSQQHERIKVVTARGRFIIVRPSNYKEILTELQAFVQERSNETIWTDLGHPEGFEVDTNIDEATSVVMEESTELKIADAASLAGVFSDLIPGAKSKDAS